MNREHRGYTGYTLIEVLLVVTILAGIGFVLLIQIPLKLDERNLDIATTQMVQVIRDTRQRALAENCQYEVLFLKTNKEYRVYRTKTLRTMKLPGRIYFNNYPSDIAFKGIGGVAGAGKVLLTNGKKENAIIVTPVTGRVRVESKNL